VRIDPELFKKAKQKANDEVQVDNNDPHNYLVLIDDATGMAMKESVETIGDLIALAGAAIEFGFYIGVRYAVLEKEKS
jgi:hypothetical protein